jgi:hypothetical protein
VKMEFSRQAGEVERARHGSVVLTKRDRELLREVGLSPDDRQALVALARAKQESILARAHQEVVKTAEKVNHPAHYGGADNPYEAIKVIEAWELGFSLGNSVKYISRAGKKDDALEDLKKARWYLNREIQNLEKKNAQARVIDDPGVGSWVRETGGRDGKRSVDRPVRPRVVQRRLAKRGRRRQG